MCALHEQSTPYPKLIQKYKFIFQESGGHSIKLLFHISTKQNLSAKLDNLGRLGQKLTA
jgi:hypothetical protein